jgi:hypothetical protein
MGKNFAVTNFTEQSCSCKGNSRSARQKKNPHSGLVVLRRKDFNGRLLPAKNLRYIVMECGTKPMDAKPILRYVNHAKDNAEEYSRHFNRRENTSLRWVSFFMPGDR